MRVSGLHTAFLPLRLSDGLLASNPIVQSDCVVPVLVPSSPRPVPPAVRHHLSKAPTALARSEGHRVECFGGAGSAEG